jgi:hypothetical protein
VGKRHHLALTTTDGKYLPFVAVRSLKLFIYLPLRSLVIYLVAAVAAAMRIEGGNWREGTFHISRLGRELH